MATKPFNRSRFPSAGSRHKTYGRIHCLMAELGISDETYRDILHVQFRKASKSDLSDRQLLQLIDHLESLASPGSRVPNHESRIGKKPRNMAVAERKDLMEKIEACLAERQLPWSYAEAMANRICKKKALEFCGPHDLWKIVAAFGYDAKRKGLPK